MGDTTDIKKGTVIRHDNDLYVVTEFQFVSPGKGTAFTKTKMKGISSGKTIDITYKSGEALDVVEVFRTTMQYLYKNDGRYSFMNTNTYETILVDEEMLGKDIRFLKEGLDVIMATHEGLPVAMELPKKVVYRVTHAPDAVKGDSTSGNVTKQIELENGLIIDAPIFIKPEEEIYVYTDDATYAGRMTE